MLFLPIRLLESLRTVRDWIWLSCEFDIVEIRLPSRLSWKKPIWNHKHIISSVLPLQKKITVQLRLWCSPSWALTELGLELWRESLWAGCKRLRIFPGKSAWRWSRAELSSCCRTGPRFAICACNKPDKVIFNPWRLCRNGTNLPVCEQWLV